MKPNKAETKVPDHETFRTSIVNGYLGKDVFSDNNGIFEARGTSCGKRIYVFKFETRQACSDISPMYEFLSQLIVNQRLEKLLFSDDVFLNRDTSPGRIFFPTSVPLKLKTDV